MNNFFAWASMIAGWFTVFCLWMSVFYYRKTIKALKGMIKEKDDYIEYLEKRTEILKNSMSEMRGFRVS